MVYVSRWQKICVFSPPLDARQNFKQAKFVYVYFMVSCCLVFSFCFLIILQTSHFVIQQHNLSLQLGLIILFHHYFLAQEPTVACHCNVIKSSELHILLFRMLCCLAPSYLTIDNTSCFDYLNLPCSLVFPNFSQCCLLCLEYYSTFIYFICYTKLFLDIVTENDLFFIILLNSLVIFILLFIYYYKVLIHQDYKARGLCTYIFLNCCYYVLHLLQVSTISSFNTQHVVLFK